MESVTVSPFFKLILEELDTDNYSMARLVDNNQPAGLRVPLITRFPEELEANNFLKYSIHHQKRCRISREECR